MAFYFQGNVQAVLDQLLRPQPPIPPPPPKGPGYRRIAAGLLLALPTLGLSLLWVARGRRMLQAPPTPPRIRYELDRPDFFIDRAKLQTVVDFLQSLRCDLDEDKPLSLELDFTPAQHEKFLQTRDEKGLRRRSRYRQTWLKLKIPLLDGSRLQLVVTRAVREKVKKKRRGYKVDAAMQDAVWVSSGAACTTQFRPPADLIWKGPGLLTSPVACYRSVRGMVVTDQRDRLLNGRRLLGACLAFAYDGVDAAGAPPTAPVATSKKKGRNQKR